MTGQPSCPLCGSADTAPLDGYRDIPPGGWNLARCARCATAFMDPMPDAGELAEAYADEYYGEGDRKLAAPAEWAARLFRRGRASLVRRLAPPAPGLILDVGCGNALMLSRLARMGFEVQGVELDTKAARRAEAALGKPVLSSMDGLPAGAYSAVTFWHSLEHLPEPGRDLDRALELLAPGGLLLVAVPNFASAQARASGVHWLHLDLPRHLHQFTAQGLRGHLAGKGLKVLLENHFSQEYNPIDTLCHLYAGLGFGPLFPFEAIRNVRRPAGSRGTALAGLLLAPVMLPLAVAVANARSAAKSGSTVTLAFQKPAA